MGEWLEDYINLNVKPAFKNAIRNFRANICIFVVIYILEVLLGAVFIASDTNDRLYDEKVGAEYDYHIVFRGVTPNSARLLQSGNRPFKVKCIGEYRVVEDDVTQLPGGELHDVYIKLIPDTREWRDNLAIVYFGFVQQFREMILSSNPGATMEVSPLYYSEAKYMTSSATYYLGSKLSQTILSMRGVRYSAYITNIYGVEVRAIEQPFLLIQAGQSLNRGTMFYASCAIFALAVSAFLLWNLFSIRTNELRHTYGIYVTFGADRRKLLALIRLEMAAIGMITVIPAYLTACLIDGALFMAEGNLISFTLGQIILIAFVTLVLIWVTLSTVVGVASRKFAYELMASGDNSNYVSSPRVSASIGKKFSGVYTLLHFRRFRKYYAQLVVIAVVFSVLFTSGIYLRGVVSMLSEQPAAQFTLQLASDVDSDFYSSFIKPELDSIEGIKQVNAELGMDASMVSSHLLFDKKAASGEDFVSVEDKAATVAAKYIVLDSNALSLLSEYEYTGELIGDGENVVVSIPVNMQESLRLNPGDKLSVATLDDAGSTYSNTADQKTMLKSQLKNNTYKYKEYNISAVVMSDRIGDTYSVYIPYEDYNELTRKAHAAMHSSFVLFSNVMMSENFYDHGTAYNIIEESEDILRAQGVTLPKLLPETIADEIVTGYDENGNYYEEIVDDHEVYEYVTATSSVTYVLGDARMQAELIEKYPKANVDALNRGQILISIEGGEGRMLNVNVGEPMVIAGLRGIRSAMGEGGANSIDEQIANYIYGYKEYEVGAIIPSDTPGFVIYLPEEDYYDILSMELYYSKVGIYIEDGLSAKQINDVGDDIKDTLIASGGGSLANHNTAFFRGMEKLNNQLGWILTVSIFMLILGIPCLIYMQIMFYRKRRSELGVMRVFGATGGEIRAMHLRDGGMLAGVTVIVFILSGIGIHKLVLMTNGRSFGLDMPIGALIVGALMLAAVSIISVMLPYAEFRLGDRPKKKKAPKKASHKADKKKAEDGAND